MINTLTNVNCEMKLIAVYSALLVFAMVIHSKAGINEILFAMSIWEFEK